MIKYIINCFLALVINGLKMVVQEWSNINMDVLGKTVSLRNIKYTIAFNKTMIKVLTMLLLIAQSKLE